MLRRIFPDGRELSYPLWSLHEDELANARRALELDSFRPEDVQSAHDGQITLPDGSILRAS